MSCDSCDLSQAMDRQKFDAVRKEAKTYAQSVSQDMAIYKEGFDYKYIRADIAISENYLIRDIVSFHQ